MPRNNSSKRMFAKQNKNEKLLNECVGMFDRILLHVDVGFTNPQMEAEIKEFLNYLRNR